MFNEIDSCHFGKQYRKYCPNVISGIRFEIELNHVMCDAIPVRGGLYFRFTM